MLDTKFLFVENSELTLLGNNVCPYSQRAKIALILSPEVFKFEPIDFLNKPDWFNDFSPLGKLPVLVTDQGPIFESDAIVSYINQKNDQFLTSQDHFINAVLLSFCRMVDHVHNTARKYFTTRDGIEYQDLGATLRKDLGKLLYGSTYERWFANVHCPLMEVYCKPLLFLIETLDYYGGIAIISDADKCQSQSNLLDNRAINELFDGAARLRLLNFLMSRDSVFSKKSESHIKYMEN